MGRLTPGSQIGRAELLALYGKADHIVAFISTDAVPRPGSQAGRWTVVWCAEWLSEGPILTCDFKNRAVCITFDADSYTISDTGMIVIPGVAYWSESGDEIPLYVALTFCKEL